MSFYKSVGFKHFEDLENYIKTKGWTDHSGDFDPFDTTNSYWFTYADTSEMYLDSPSVAWSIKKEGSHWSIQEIFTLHGSRAYNSIDITEEIVELYNAMIEKRPIYIQIEKDITNEVSRGRVCSGTLLAQTKVKVVDISRDTCTLLGIDSGVGVRNNIILEDKFSTHVKFKRNIYSMETDDEIKDRKQQWKYASRYGRR